MDFSALKEHKWTVAVVAVGAFIVYRYLSSSHSTPTTVVAQSPTGTDNSAAAQLAASQYAAAASVQNAQIQADTVNQQTQASIAASNNQLQAQLAQVAAALDLGKYQTDAQTVTAGMQERVALANIDASNNQAALAEQVALAQTKAASDITSQYLADSYDLATVKQAGYQGDVNYILQHAGDKKNSQLDATDQTSLFQTILSGGNAGVAATGTNASTATATEEKAGTVAQNGAIISASSGIAKSIVDGLF